MIRQHSNSENYYMWDVKKILFVDTPLLVLDNYCKYRKWREKVACRQENC